MSGIQRGGSSGCSCSPEPGSDTRQSRNLAERSGGKWRKTGRFPRIFHPSFPIWCLAQAPIDQHLSFIRFYENALDVESKAFERWQNLAKKYHAFLSIGITEKSGYSMGAMWNTNSLFDKGYAPWQTSQNHAYLG